jgi:hypothetical protein
MGMRTSQIGKTGDTCNQRLDGLRHLGIAGDGMESALPQLVIVDDDMKCLLYLPARAGHAHRHPVDGAMREGKSVLLEIGKHGIPGLLRRSEARREFEDADGFPVVL